MKADLAYSLTEWLLAGFQKYFIVKIIITSIILFRFLTHKAISTGFFFFSLFFPYFLKRKKMDVLFAAIV